ncbi:MAG: extracellular solute-binding protein [Microbacterium sp.]
MTLRVGNLPSADNEEQRAAFEAAIDEFEELYPNITIEAEETAYDAQTFNAQLAAGTLPTVLAVPATEMQRLIALDQVRDLSEFYADSDELQSINPQVLATVQDDDGAYFGVPKGSFSLALIINRSVFEEAGLDPDTVDLSTWDAVAAAAEQITQNTDAIGYGQLTTTNQGGWVLSALSAGFGSEIQETDAEGVTTANVDSAGTEAALEWLHDLRWESDAMGSEVLLDFSDLGPLFASGQYGMLVGASEWYTPLTANYGMPSDDFGIYPLPQSADGLGTLGGGTIDIVPATASDAEAAAAVKWSTFRNVEKYFDLDLAASNAESLSADGSPVPSVGLPLVDDETYSAYLAAIEPYINVNLDHIEPYTSTADELAIVPEPPVEAQQTYGVLDAVLQEVLSNEDADIGALLATAQTDVQGIIDGAQD